MHKADTLLSVNSALFLYELTIEYSGKEFYKNNSESRETWSASQGLGSTDEVVRCDFNEDVSMMNKLKM